YLNLVSFTVLFCEYFQHLDSEVSRYWGLHFTWPNILFFANRYGTLLGNIPVVMEYFWSKNSSPEKIRVSVPLAMLVLRTYALYERSKRVLAMMLTVVVGAVAVGLWSVLTGMSVDESTDLPVYFGCNHPISREHGLSLAASWAGVAVFDCMIFLLTLYKVFSRRRQNGPELLTVLLRDGKEIFAAPDLPNGLPGSIYFGVMVVSNVSNILMFILGTPYTRGIATSFTNIISSVMISRLMLNLRDPALSHMSGRLRLSTTITAQSLRFAPNQGVASPVLDTDATMGACDTAAAIQYHSD
ncbi:hypothetical protein B0H13DRAFT_1608528, partial [Mycena leptocephala]